MNDLHWYIGCTRSCQDKRVAEATRKRGYEVFVAQRREVHQWSDRKKVVDRLLIPRMIFVRCPEQALGDLLRQIPYLTGFLSDKADGGKRAVVPDSQMDTFIAVVDAENETITFVERQLRPGDTVRVKYGALEGRVVELVSIDGRDCLAVRLPILGAACVQIDRNSVELLKK